MFANQHAKGSSGAQEVLLVLESLRIPPVQEEREIYPYIKTALKDANIPFEQEVHLGPKSRIDFLTSCGTGIEVKKGRPNANRIIKQLSRYCKSERVEHLIVVVPWRKNLKLPDVIEGKRTAVISLNKLWGVSL